MPALEAHGRYQKTCLWPAVTGSSGRVSNDLDGNPIVTAEEPTEIFARWDDSSRRMVDPRGNVVQVDASLTVDRDVAIGSQVWKGGMDDLPGTALVPESDVMVAVAFDATEDLKHRFVNRIVGLMRLKDVLGNRA